MQQKDKIKSNSKAIGLKSTLVFDDKIVLTSFAKSENKKIKNNIEKISDFNGNLISESPILFNANINKDNINLSKKINLEDGPKEAKLDNPIKTDIGRDYINIKDSVEEVFFNKTFKNDNARIQIAYNILDIKKILNPYINNIIYMFYNLSRRTNIGEEEYSDLIGTLYFNNDYEYQQDHAIEHKNEQEKNKKIDSLLKEIINYNFYFGDAFKVLDKKDKKNERKIKEINNYNYNVLRILSMVRQITEHYTVKVKKENALKSDKNEVLSEALLFNLDTYLNNSKELLDIINEKYSAEIKKLNDGFLETSKMNVYILSKIYKDDISEIIKEYYDFIVKKDQKNLGVNVKKIRETIIENKLFELKSNDYDSYRSKIYKLMDFIIAKFLKKSSVMEEMIMKLRNVLTEADKEKTYKEYSLKIWNNGEVQTQIKNMISLTKKIISNVSSFSNEFNQVRKKLGELYANGKMLTVSNENTFVKLIYFITQFLDGKEINILLCSLISKFENIAEIANAMKACDDKVVYSPEFKMFESSVNIARSLKVVKNFARMKISKNNITSEAIIDAYNLLNISDSITKFDVDGKMTLEYKQTIDSLFKEQKKLKNFILNNVIGSKWFLYVARYNSPEKCKMLFKNKSLIELALKEIPRKQLDRYFSTINGFSSEQLSDKEVKDSLLNKLHNFSIGKINNGIVTEKQKALVQFYLTIIYLITKNMVTVNSRFSIAFGCLERDMAFIGTKKKDKLSLTKYFIEKDQKIFDEQDKERIEIRDSGLSKEEMKELYKENNKKLKSTHYKKHSFDYVKSNLEEAKQLDEVINVFRNKVLHLNILDGLESILDDKMQVSSYYGLYCYVLQKMLLSEKNELLKKYENYIIENNNYNKDLMWVLNSGFGYNLARYKKLSNEDIFYDNYFEEKGEK